MDSEPFQEIKDGEFNKVIMEKVETGQIVKLESKCDSTTGFTKIQSKMKFLPKTQFQFAGELCASKIEDLDIIFITDMSASMAIDREKNGTCKRLDAVNALVNKLLKASYASDKINIAGISFGSDAMTMFPFTDIKSIKDRYLKAEDFCKHNSGGTNYDEALFLAKDILRNSQKNIAVYFITDGEPSGYDSPSFRGTGVNSPKEAAKYRLDELRAAHPKMKFNFIIAQENFADYKKRNIEEIIGNSKDIIFSEGVDLLAANIIKFSFPEAIIDYKNAKAQFNSDKNVTLQNIPLEFVRPSPNDERIFNFETSLFTLDFKNQPSEIFTIQLIFPGTNKKPEAKIELSN